MKFDPEKSPKDGYIFIDIVRGCDGDALCVGDESGGTRVCGPKPWGGGEITKRFEVSLETLRAALPPAGSP